MTTKCVWCRIGKQWEYGLCTRCLRRRAALLQKAHAERNIPWWNREVYGKPGLEAEKRFCAAAIELLTELENNEA